MTEQEILNLSADEFLDRLTDLIVSNKLTRTQYDPGEGVIHIEGEIDGKQVTFHSPYIIHMLDPEYIRFRRVLDLIMPATDPERGFYW